MPPSFKTADAQMDKSLSSLSKSLMCDTSSQNRNISFPIKGPIKRTKVYPQGVQESLDRMKDKYEDIGIQVERKAENDNTALAVLSKRDAKRLAASTARPANLKQLNILRFA